jgi:hypothetical protein
LTSARDQRKPKSRQHYTLSEALKKERETALRAGANPDVDFEECDDEEEAEEREARSEEHEARLEEREAEEEGQDQEL